LGVTLKILKIPQDFVKGTDETCMKSSSKQPPVGPLREGPTNSTRRMVALTAAIIAAEFVIVDRFLTTVGKLSEFVDLATEACTLTVTAAAALWIKVIRPLRREADAERQISLDREEALLVESRRQEFEASLHRAMEMAGTEEAVYHTTAKAIPLGTPNLDAEVLLADSSDAHLKRAVAVGGDQRHARCGVVAPRDCPAIRRAQTLTFASSEDLEACPHLENRDSGPCAAVCVPISVGGRSIGVLHAATDPSQRPTAADSNVLEAVATEVGGRLGMLRVMEAIHLQAATDPLTGLLNRRSFENRAQDLIRRQVPFALAMGDLDHFKKLNDTHGHDAGDRALRAFSQTLRASLRGEDLVCRYGGEEFVILFPQSSATVAAAALGRVQQELLVSVAGGAVAPFTVSFGVTNFEQDQSLEEVCRVADAALFRAKREGRNRVVIDSFTDVVITDPLSTSATEDSDKQAGETIAVV
jgi:diguanylate cyclase (GGDEF)-like protein